MPLSQSMTIAEMIRELLESWRKTGKIGNIRPRNARHARRIARAIALRVKYGKPSTS